LDEAIFIPRSQKMRTWAPTNTPLSTQHRWAAGNYLAVMAAISVNHGLELTKYKYQAAFDTQDFIDFLEELQTSHTGTKILVFLDNCSIHKGA
jgi:hypothetical protein